MSRPATGTVLERVAKSGEVTFAARFRAYGKRQVRDSWNEGRRVDEEESRNRAGRPAGRCSAGIWKPDEPEVVEAPTEVPTFHEFASNWLAARAPELRPRTVEDYTWALSHHLLPFFKDH